ncbi:MAG TPA: UDP-glucose/GDP-mannose dehydrogenase family protein [Candidatus Acidoferrales bacterium]|nr:UDP-glucose/GDP-mannose dehydrogenase family protein [Candidatus Acidoferrales bacterium]
MRIAVIGSGYVGLVSGACLAEIGHEVICADNDSSKIRALNSGHIPIFEENLDAIVAKLRTSGRLKFTDDIPEAVRAGDAIFICVGTPPLETGDADLSAIENVARVIAAEARSPKLVIEKSTVPVQTGKQVKRALQVYGRGHGVQFHVASNPEFLREGTAVEDFLHPDRIVMGVEDPAAERQLREIYRPILEQNFYCPIHSGKCPPSPPVKLVVTTINSAELIKHASNSFLALKISYANLIADLCERLGADVDEVTAAMGMDPRIGSQFLKAGLGFGGFCLPKDVQAFIRLAETASVDFGVLKEAEFVNKRRISAFIERMRKALWIVKDKQVGALGLAFKANTDDIRFSPAIDVLTRICREGARVIAHDPQAIERSRAVLPGVQFTEDPYATANGSEALLILTEWPQFRALDWKRIRAAMVRPLVIDGRNLLNPREMEELGFEYYSFGRPERAAAPQPANT